MMDSKKNLKFKGIKYSIWIFISLIICIVTLLIFSQNWKDSLRVNRVIVEGAKLLTAKEIVEVARIKSQHLLFQINLSLVRNRLLEHPLIKLIHLKRQIPNTLYVNIVERVPIALLCIQELFLIDEEGAVLPYLHQSADNSSWRKLDLPVISGIAQISNLKPGLILIHEEIFQAIEILKIAKELGFENFISEINMNGGGDIYIYTVDTAIPIIFGRGDYRKKMITLLEFWNRFVDPDSAKRLRYIDIRFDAQIVVKWQQPDNRSENLLKNIMFKGI